MPHRSSPGPIRRRRRNNPLYGDLAGLPPLLIVAGAREVLLDDARRFAGAAGATVQLDICEGMTHAFHAAILAPDAALPPTARLLLERVRAWTEGLPGAPS